MKIEDMLLGNFIVYAEKVLERIIKAGSVDEQDPSVIALR
jgi:hypothetical protein